MTPRDAPPPWPALGVERDDVRIARELKRATLTTTTTPGSMSDRRSTVGDASPLEDEFQRDEQRDDDAPFGAARGRDDDGAVDDDDGRWRARRSPTRRPPRGRVASERVARPGTHRGRHRPRMRSRVGQGSPPRATRDATCHWVGAPFESSSLSRKTNKERRERPTA